MKILMKKEEKFGYVKVVGLCVCFNTSLAGVLLTAMNSIHIPDARHLKFKFISPFSSSNSHSILVWLRSNLERINFYQHYYCRSYSTIAKYAHYQATTFKEVCMLNFNDASNDRQIIL